MMIRDLIETFNGNQKLIMIKKGDVSIPVMIDELEDVELNRVVAHWSTDQRTVYIDVK